MPSSPKIPKEKILKAALDLLIREGYPALNIKALAKEIGCSTQPISWHFGNMEGLRIALADYALAYANNKMVSRSATNGMNGFLFIGLGYVDIAFDEPNLFQYLFMNLGSGYHSFGVDMLANAEENAIIAEQIAFQLNITKECAGVFLRNSIIYTHGLATLIASGMLLTTKAEIESMLKEAAHSFLLCTGVDLEKFNEKLK